MKSASEVWKQFAEETGGRYEWGRGLGVRDKVTVPSGPWHVVISSVDMQFAGNVPGMLTCVGATYVSTGNLRFSISRKTVFTHLGRLLGMQDIIVGDPVFDRRFTVKGNNIDKVKELLADEKLRGMLGALARVHLAVLDNVGPFTRKFRDDVDELYFQVPGEVPDSQCLRELLNLFVATLNRLVAIGAATNQDPNGVFSPPSTADVAGSLDG